VPESRAQEKIETTATKPLNPSGNVTSTQSLDRVSLEDRDRRRAANLLELQKERSQTKLNGHDPFGDSYIQRRSGSHNRQKTTTTKFDPFSDPFSDRHIDAVFEQTTAESADDSLTTADRPLFRLEAPESTMLAGVMQEEIRLNQAAHANIPTSSSIQLHQPHVPFLAQRSRINESRPRESGLLDLPRTDELAILEIRQRAEKAAATKMERKKSRRAPSRRSRSKSYSVAEPAKVNRTPARVAKSVVAQSSREPARAEIQRGSIQSARRAPMPESVPGNEALPRQPEDDFEVAHRMVRDTHPRRRGTRSVATTVAHNQQQAAPLDRLAIQIPSDLRKDPFSDESSPTRIQDDLEDLDDLQIASPEEFIPLDPSSDDRSEPDRGDFGRADEDSNEIDRGDLDVDNDSTLSEEDRDLSDPDGDDSDGTKDPSDRTEPDEKDSRESQGSDCGSIYNERNCCDEAELCRSAWERLNSATIADIKVSITPPIVPLAESDEDVIEKRQKLSESDWREWRNREGTVVASGQMVDFRQDRVIVQTDSGGQVAIPFYGLHHDDVCFVTAWWGLPAECLIDSNDLAVRDYRKTTFTWKAASVCHKPLYFEDVQLERYGHSAGPVLQPLISGAHFFGNVLLLPYNMGVYTPSECRYALGYYRPGSCAPWVVPAFPLSKRGLTFELAAALGFGLFLD
jgi:hypothetical protein